MGLTLGGAWTSGSEPSSEDEGAIDPVGLVAAAAVASRSSQRG